MPTTYTQGHERLRQLPDVFNINTLSRLMHMPKQQTLGYLLRWRQRGWVEQAGPRAGIYFNLIKNPGAADEFRVDALVMEYPSAVLIGESVLHAAGWITQVPAALQVAIEKTSARRSYKHFFGFELHPKPLLWFEQMHKQILHPSKAGFSSYGLRTLAPAIALADLYATVGAWHPDPDDLHLPD